MRLTELHEVTKEGAQKDAPGLFWNSGDAASAEWLIQRRLSEGSIGWSEPLAFGVPDASRVYKVRR